MLLLLVEAALHSILLGVATWLGLTLLRIRDAEAEMIVWKIVLVAAVAMPLLVPLARVTIPGGQTFLSPHVDASATSVPDLDWPSPGPTFKAVETLTPGTATPALEPAGRIPVETIDWLDVATGLYLIVPVETIDWLDVATGLYLTVSGVLLLKLLIGLTMTFRLARTARPIEAEWSEGASVRVSESVSLPATFASVVLLPADWETWNTVKRRAVLAHELAHVAHGDFYVLLLAMLYHVAFWFNPLSWWLLHRVRELMEILSDDAAIADLGDAPSYAEVILEVAASVRSTPMLIGMARASTVHRRIERILARTERPPSLGRLKRAWLASGLLPLVAASAVTVASGTPKEQGASIVAQASVPGQPPLRPTDDRALLDSYVGNYERESSAATEPRVFTVIRKDDRLLLKQTGMAIGNGFPLFPKNDRTFTYVPVVGGSESELTFVRGDQGQITTIVVHFVVRGEGEDFTARRVDEAEARRATELHNQRLAAQRQPRVAIRIDPALFDRYVGAYKLSMGQVIVVERDGDQFFLRNEVPGFQRIRIYPESETSYFAEDFHEQINFVTNPQGQVTELIQHMGGWSNTARRIGEAEVRLAEAAIAERSRRLIERRADERRPREAIAVEPSLSDRYTGVYEGAWGAGRQLLTVTREGDQLYTQMGGQAKLPIYPEHEHAFFYKGIPAQLTFVVEGQGMASKVILHHNGHELMSQRIADWPKADRQPPAVDP
ncbi:MAG: DUF3471 domain-containing protein, partial [Bradyrhizobium sp.]|nr:DUF3471 domain-containing protein [Bradyrhizobium sp.]